MMHHKLKHASSQQEQKKEEHSLSHKPRQMSDDQNFEKTNFGC